MKRTSIWEVGGRLCGAVVCRLRQIRRVVVKQRKSRNPVKAAKFTMFCHLIFLSLFLLSLRSSYIYGVLSVDSKSRFFPRWSLTDCKKSEIKAIKISSSFFLVPCLLLVTGVSLKTVPTLLSWEIVHKKMPWNIVLLLGGGFALAKGSEVIQ